MWTLQEFATAPKVTICFGTAAVPLETFVRVTDIHGDGGDSGDSDDGEDGRAFWSREFSNRFGSLNESAAYEPLAPLRFSRHKNKYKTSPDKNKGRPLPSWVVDWTSYPWNDNDIIPIPTRTRKLSSEIVPWLQIKPCKDLDQDDRTVEHPTRMIGATRYNATKGIKGNPPSISTDHILTVSGMAIGTVREVALVSCHAAWKLARAGEGASDKERRDRRAMVLRTLAADMLDQPVDWARIGEFWVSLLEALEVAEMRLGEETNNGMRMGPTFFEDVAMRAGKTIRTRYERSEEMATDNLDAAFPIRHQ
ncbi:hypothetical protein NW754_004177 [Fusarium falciforme]|nr:hypothetical protein NW754_004177 [Fusarium falciforme]